MPATAALLFYLDAQGRVVDVHGSLRHRLEQPAAQQPTPLLDYLTPMSSLVIEGTPADWQGQSLDLEFKGLAGQTLHTRGWVQPEGKGWLLHLLDIGDLVAHRQLTQAREHNQRVSDQVSEHLRVCSLARLPEVLQDTLQTISQHWHIPCVAIAVLDEAGQEWRIQGRYTSHDAPVLWSNGQALGTSLDSLGGTAPVSLGLNRGHGDHPRLQGLFSNTYGFLVPYRDAHGVAAWLLCGFFSAQTHTSDRDWLQLAAAVATPLLNRLREQRHQQQLDRLEALQGLLGTGWWELPLHSEDIELAPQLLHTLSQGEAATRLSLPMWLNLIHPADREELASRLQDLKTLGKPLSTSVRLQRADAGLNPIWYRVQGQALGSGEHRRLVGFMLDISDIKNQEQQAAAAHARLDNLIASSPAVIYVQRYVEGTLQPVFFSDSLLPLLGHTLADCTQATLNQWIHPEDRDLYFDRTRQLLREGSVRSRYRVRDKQGDYHWLLDEARLLRDDLGLPVEAVGLWLDITEATLAGQRVKESEERYRILVEDSPAMICR